ncbi:MULTISPECIES: RHS repeat domain-containing protein [unclassified Methylocaldum]|jgi:YD repeat-containing protein|uniref:RHS repeat domain-containing protein n=1 Tax=unclassified Methylocaldum TaxID=2622260 RepID=UPI000A31F107|nr:RHS repeat domain-containing protein [Methylocaldum sp. RMAD-M]MBP1153063.1 YD repeat-containing protein [Methylocaldum sp. RMAD-M]MVF24136.1 hypothetical protein [Methylocaldum sp. BRCS4]
MSIFSSLLKAGACLGARANTSIIASAAVAASLAGPAWAGSVTYTYDTLGRVITATYSNGVVITYSYDAAGNRTSHLVTGAPS